MDDLISRQAAINAIRIGALSTAMLYGRTDEGMTARREIERAINGLPSAQTEIIRCKDCKYGSPNEVYGCRLEPFSTHDRGSRMYADDFCSRAERRTDDSISD